jgi:SET domain-containing protein
VRGSRRGTGNTWQKVAGALNDFSVPPLTNIRVVRSRIHGYGCVAKRDIEPNEVIAEVDGVVYSAAELGDDTYCLWVHQDCYFDMVDQTRWINHSCDPNAEVEAEEDGKGGAWARIIASRRIAAGEEITYHYAFAQELAEPCNCGAPECEGWIVDPDERPALDERLARERGARAGTG